MEENTLNTLNRLAADLDAKIDEISILPDGSGFATMSMPLPKDHWLTKESADYEPPPMPFRMGMNDRMLVHRVTQDAPRQASPLPALSRDEIADKIRAAGRYAVRSATMKGKDMDFDPDALLQNLVVGLLGYWTNDGLSGDEWANPSEYRAGKA